MVLAFSAFLIRHGTAEKRAEEAEQRPLEGVEEEEAGVEKTEEEEVEAETRREDTEVEVEVKKVNGETAEMKLTKLQTKLLTKMKLNSLEFTMGKFKISQLLDVLFN